MDPLWTARTSSAASSRSRRRTSTAPSPWPKNFRSCGRGARLRCDRSARSLASVLEDIFREDWGRVVASLVGSLRDIELAEDAAQEAFAIAAERWPRDGLPPNPTGWLITTARNRAIDRIRRERTLAAKTGQLERELREGSEEAMEQAATFPDERLELIFTCCHPALALDAQV